MPADSNFVSHGNSMRSGKKFASRKVRIVRCDWIYGTYLVKMLNRFTKYNYERKANAV